MLQRIKNLILTLAFSFGTLTPLAVPVVVHADIEEDEALIGNNLCEGANLKIGDDASEDCSAEGDESVASTANGLVAKIINIFSWVVGIVAVIMIIFGGFRYITSGGNDNNVSSAKNTILYAIIGLVIVAFAQFIVKFVLERTTGASE
jgi:hypothetical protein